LIYIIAATDMAETPSNFSEFDAAVVGGALGADPRTTRDIAHGDGQALALGETTLEVYRDAGFARVTTPDARIELYRVPRYTVSGERVVFEQGDQDDRSRLLVRGDGKVSFYPVLRATEPPTAPESTSGAHQDSPPPQATPESPAAGSPEALGSTEPREAELVQIKGHVGRGPWFSGEGDAGFGRFALGEKVDPALPTKWHNDVLVFGQVANDLQAAHRKGTMGVGAHVEVTGQHTTAEYQTDSGKVRRRPEFHVAEFTILKPPRRSR
jgi:hypothetical protein